MLSYLFAALVLSLACMVWGLLALKRGSPDNVQGNGREQRLRQGCGACGSRDDCAGKDEVRR